MSRIDDQQLYDELVSLCYQCVLDERKWRELLQRLIYASGRQQGGLLVMNEDTNIAQISEVNFFDPSAATPYNEYFYQHDPGKIFVPRRAVGDWYHDFIDYGEKSIKRSPYYQEFHRDYGLGNNSSIKIFESTSSSIYLSLLTNLDAKKPGPKQQELLKRMSTHLTTAGHMCNYIHNLKLNLATRDLLLDNHPTPVWLVDEAAHVHYCNRAAAEYVLKPHALLGERFSRLRSMKQDNLVQALIHRATTHNGPRQPGWLRLAQGSQQELLITPMPVQSALGHIAEKPLALIALLEQKTHGTLLAELFQLSQAEQRLAELLVQQHSPEDCARHLHVSLNTVRTQLRALFRKTGTSRQSELLSLIGRLHF